MSDEHNNTSFENLPMEIRKNILSRIDITTSMLISTTYNNALKNEFINSPSLPTLKEISYFMVMTTRLSFVTVSIYKSGSLMLKDYIVENDNTHNTYFWISKNNIYIRNNSVQNPQGLRLKNALDIIAEEIHGTSIFDPRLWYYALRYRSDMLLLNLDDTLIKSVVVNIIHKINDELLEYGIKAAFCYLLLSLRALGVSIEEYRSHFNDIEEIVPSIIVVEDMLTKLIRMYE